MSSASVTGPSRETLPVLVTTVAVGDDVADRVVGRRVGRLVERQSRGLVARRP